MFDPVTLAVVAAGSAAVAATGTIVSGIQQKKAADADAKAAKQKAKYDESIHRDRVKRLLSKQRGIIGKSGVDISGTPLLATLDTIEKGELDALAIRQGGEATARRSKAQGKSALTGSLFSAGSTLLSGGVKARQIQKGF